MKDAVVIPLLVCSLAASSCGDRAGPQVGQDSAHADTAAARVAAASALGALRSEVACVEMSERGLAFAGGTRAELLDQLGAPLGVEATAVQGFGNAQDSLFMVRYPGLLATSHKPAGGAEMVDGFRISDNRWLRYPEAGVGIPAEQLIRLLGEPAERTDEQITYACHSHAANDNPVAFRLAHGRVAEVIFMFYMD